ncbi:MAG: hypothetical protein ACRDY3_09425 [Acidimicrobiales bacterium]
MDEAERQRFLATLHNEEAFRDAVRRELMIHDLLELPEKVADQGATLDVLVEHQAELQRATTSIQAELQRATASIRADVAVLVETTGQVLRITSDGFARIGGEVSGLRGELSVRFTAHEARFDQVDAAIAELKDQRRP